MLKKDKNNFDFISDKFEKENISLPDALSESSIREKIENKEAVKIKFNKSKTINRVISLAACIAVVVTSLSVAVPMLKEDKTPKITNNERAVVTFSSYEEIKSTVDKLQKESSSEDIKDSSNAGMGSNEEGGAGADTSYAKTYRQVDMVDEGDVIKNDGKYIYYLTTEDVVNIYQINGRETNLVSSIKDFENRYYADVEDTNDFEEKIISDIYVNGNRLVMNVTRDICKGDDYQSFSQVYIYDISDIKNPKQLKNFEQSGYYLSSRMIEDQLYVVSNFTLNKTKSYYIPYTLDSGEEKTPLKAENICRVNDPKEPNYLVVSAIDVKAGKRSSETKAVFGAGNDMYSNESNMYVVSSEYVHPDTRIREETAPAPNINSQIIKISLSDKIAFTASCTLKGNINNQFSLDEKDGFLRVATTSTGKDGKDVNNLFVLDKNLKKVGAVTGFAKDESIKAVKFIGDTAYVITYEETDPLFVIDLTNPKSPQIKGSVKITGFSTQLIPYEDNMLIGIGFDMQRDETGGWFESGIKLVLFDVSNPEKPKVLDSKVLEDSNSLAQYNHKAIVVNPEKKYYAIPYDHYGNDENNYFYDAGILTFEIESKKIKVTNIFTKNYDSTSGSARCTYADDFLYSFTEYYDGDMNNKIDFDIYEMK